MEETKNGTYSTITRVYFGIKFVTIGQAGEAWTSILLVLYIDGLGTRSKEIDFGEFSFLTLPRLNALTKVHVFYFELLIAMWKFAHWTLIKRLSFRNNP